MIIFDQTSHYANFKNDAIVKHVFTGHNTTDKTVKILSHNTSCSCVSLDYSEEILPESAFKITYYVNKIGQTGLFATDAKIVFDDDTTKTLNLSGYLKQ